jgi:FkbM family methyltransferase
MYGIIESMLITVRQLAAIWRVGPIGVLHVGAHEAEEFDDYKACGWMPVIWVEANPDRAAQLQSAFIEDFSNEVIEAVAWDTHGEKLSFFETNNGQSSSVLRLGTHQDSHPEVVVVSESAVVSSRLDRLLTPRHSRFELVVLDVQGAELHALKGLGDKLHGVKWIYAEVNVQEVYDGGPLLGEFDDYCRSLGFLRVDTLMTKAGWGDALYCRSDVVPTGIKPRRMLRRAVGNFGRGRRVVRGAIRRISTLVSRSN